MEKTYTQKEVDELILKAIDEFKHNDPEGIYFKSPEQKKAWERKE